MNKLDIVMDIEPSIFVILNVCNNLPWLKIAQERNKNAMKNEKLTLKLEILKSIDDKLEDYINKRNMFVKKVFFFVHPRSPPYPHHYCSECCYWKIRTFQTFHLGM